MLTFLLSGDVQDCQGVSASEMTCIVEWGVKLYSLTQFIRMSLQMSYARLVRFSAFSCLGVPLIFVKWSVIFQLSKFLSLCIVYPTNVTTISCVFHAYHNQVLRGQLHLLCIYCFCLLHLILSVIGGYIDIQIRNSSHLAFKCALVLLSIINFY